jgi:hypothetical protein
MLEPLLRVYQAQLIAEIGHDDWARATQEEEFSLETVAAKWDRVRDGDFTAREIS